MCPRNRTWERLYTATDSHGNDVIVSPKYYLAGIEFQQRFYTVNCDYETLANESACDKCCLAIDHSRYDKTYMSEILNFMTSMCIKQYTNVGYLRDLRRRVDAFSTN